MEESEKERIDQITASVHRLLKGDIPDPISVADDPEDEIRQLSEKVNGLRDQFKEVKDFIVPLSEGKLDLHLPRGNFLASPFKNLQASLNHLTWQTQQIAQGDFNQRVDFMGDFSEAFNKMVLALRETREQMLSEADRYKKLAEIKNHYLNVMAHDIRTPIGAVIGFSDILLEGIVSAKDRKYVEIIRRNSDSLLSLINNILDMARIENRKMEIDALPFSIKEMGEDLREMFELRLREGIKFLLETDSRIPDQMIGDPGRLRQVLVNLLGNAAKFTEAGSIRLKMEVIDISTDRVSIRFTVADTGIGIPKKSLSAVFDPFVQAEKGIAGRFGGSGLGLAISRELVSLMRGELSVESSVGKGTAFSFTLSFAVFEQDAGAAPETGGASALQPLISSRKCNILVVDDDPYSLKIFDRILGRQNIRYTLCESGRKAFDLLISAFQQKKPFTLAWLDIDMPDMNGVELARMIRSDPRFNRLRIVACTAFAEHIEVEDPSYFSFITTKPITPKALERILSEARASYPASGGPGCDLSGLRVLVADDNSINRFLIKSMAQKMSIEVLEAENGREAVEMANKESFDIILMDKMMPVMGGIEAIEAIRKTLDPTSLPIIGFTADDSEEDQAAMLAAGANAILKKPVGYDDLAEGFCSALEQRNFPETV